MFCRRGRSAGGAVAGKRRPGRRVQLHRALSKLGWGSRTQAWAWIDPGHHVPRTYRVTVAGRPTEEALAVLRTGVDLPDGRTRPAAVRLLEEGRGTSVLEVVLTEGRNRQVRRMLRAIRHKVKRLVRV